MEVRMANAVCDQLDQDFAPPGRWDRDFFNLQWFAEFVHDGRLHLRDDPRLHVFRDWLSQLGR